MYCREGKSKIIGRFFQNFFQNSGVIRGSAVKGKIFLKNFQKTLAISASHDRLAVEGQIQATTRKESQL